MGVYVMTVLKNLTWDNHKRAEKTEFMKRLAKRQLSPREYYDFLSNQRVMYQALEDAGERSNLFDGISTVKRTKAIESDLEHLERIHAFRSGALLNAASDYVRHIEEISSDSNKLLAHFYVRYMGDLYGGQILKKLVPGPGAYYDFDDVGSLKEKLGSKLDVSMADEANRCFDMMISFLEELDERINE
jgi:heme oxygenase